MSSIKKITNLLLKSYMDTYLIDDDKTAIIDGLRRLREIIGISGALSDYTKIEYTEGAVWAGYE
jgi:ABC-type maltose transport system permease subunit